MSAPPIPDDKAVDGFLAKANPNPDPVNSRAFARSIPHHLLPDKIGDMELDPELIKTYKGHENLLKLRALHSPVCYRMFDAMRLCILDRLDEDTCREVSKAYQPCDDDLKRRALEKKMSSETQRRQLLAAQAKVIEQASAAGGPGQLPR